MHCPNCGKLLNDNQKFCGGCGSDVSELWQQPTPVAAAPVVDATAQPAPEPVQAAAPVTPEPEPVAAPVMPMPEPIPVEQPQVMPEPVPVENVQVMPEPVPVEAAPAPVAVPVEAAPAAPAPAVQSYAPAPAPAPAPGPEAAPAPAFGELVNQAPVAQPVQAAQPDGVNAPNKKKKAVIGIIIGVSATVLAIIVASIIGIIALVKKATKETERTKHTTEETAEPTPAAPAQATRTVMVYAIGTDLESQGSTLSADIKEMMTATPGKSVNIVLQTGGCKNFNNTYMRDGATQRFSIINGNINELEDLGDVSMVEPQTLEDFIKFGKENFPAENYILVLWDHGGGVPLGFGFDELHEGTLTEIEMAEAISHCDIEFETIIFNACLMGSLEVAKALDPYTEYIVAAESPTWGSAYYDIGINYTNFLNYIGKDFNGDAKDYSEFIVRDYMDTIEALQDKTGYYGLDTCMSAIDTDNVDEVLEAYEKLIAALDKRVFEQGGYAEYVQLRNDCGEFQSSDSVDLMTLATKYINCGDQAIQSAASSVINEVGNCVFTESNNSYTYAHGITVYSPFLYPDLYDDARQSFITLGYQDTTVYFYDKFVSKELYILNAVGYAGSWYVEPSDAKSIKAGNTYDLESFVVDMGGYEAIKLASDDWKNIREVKVTLAYTMPDDTDKIYYMGTDNQYTIDSNGYIILQNPTNWVYFKTFGFVTCECMKYEVNDEGKWSKYLAAEAIINGQTGYVIIAFSSDDPDGQMIGYYYADIINDTFDSNQGYQFNDDDTVSFVAEYYDINSQTMEYYELGTAVTYAEAVSLYKYSRVDYGDVTGYIAFDIYDVYNNDYRLALRPGTPAYEIDAIRGDNNGSSSGSDYDEGTMDVTDMVDTIVFYSSDNVLYMHDSNWTSPNDALKEDSVYYSSTSSIVLTVDIDAASDESFTYTFYYSSDSMFSERELSNSVASGTVNGSEVVDGKDVYNFEYAGENGSVPAGYYILTINNGKTKDRVAITVCQVLP